MSELEATQVAEDPVESDQNEEKSSSEIEELAAQLGWSPNFRGDKEDFVDAKTFILRSRDIQKTMSQTLKEQKRAIAELRGGLDALKLHNETVYKAEVAKLKAEMKDLEKAKKEAIVEGDVDRVAQLDQQLDVLKESTKAPPPVTQTTQANPDFDEWHDANPWYLTDQEMTAYADARWQSGEYRGLSMKRAYSKVREEVEKMFPDKFPKKQAPTPPVSAVEGARPRQSRGRTFTKADLSDEQREVLRSFKKLGVMSEQEYIDGLVTAGELR